MHGTPEICSTTDEVEQSKIVLIGELARHRRSKLSVTLANREKGRAGQKAFIWKIISRQGEYCPVSTKRK
ncbi:hypothetical protein [Brucella intermedia]|uniref:hypothetical protein n=1 Tax=Brucella intermedia TaxID=94625 RepID=UPI00178C1B31|nr:hypothetical protein [Brucella intermedia]